MTIRKPLIPAAVLAAALSSAGLATVTPHAAHAQAAAPAAPAPRPMRPSHIDGRLAFLKAELKITPAQEPQWDRVAQALRQNDQERREAFEQMRANRDQPHNALQHLEMRARLSAQRAQQTDRFLAAFRPLYDSLSDVQKKSADDLMAPHWRHHGRRGI